MAEGEVKTGRRAAFGQGFLTDIWHFAALSSDLKKGRLARHEILGEPVLIGRSPAGALVALRDICPHRAAPLSAGRFARQDDGAECVECPYHGWRFRLDGECAAIPSLTEEQEFDASRVRVRRYPVVENQGLVFIWMAAGRREEAQPTEPAPLVPGPTAGQPRIVLKMDFRAHIDHAVVGLMDPAHGPFVHHQWWWRSRASSYAKAKRFEPATAGFTMVSHPPSTNSRAYRLLGGRPLTQITFRLPGLRWEQVTVGARRVFSLTALTPVDSRRTRVTQVLWSDHPVFAVARPLIALAARRFLQQDGDMVKLQNQGLRYDPPLLWIDDADRQAKWYQALKREWTASRLEGRAFVNPVEAATLRWIS